jgi:hypothetical protein
MQRMRRARDAEPTRKQLSRSRSMITIVSPTNSLRAAVESVEQIWMLTIAFSFFHYAMAVDLAGRNAEAFAVFARAVKGTDVPDAPARSSEISAEHADLSAEDRLASDERCVECKGLGATMNSLTMPVRKDLILASSVVC